MQVPPPPPPPLTSRGSSANGQITTRWEYKLLRLDYKGRGITQEINILDVDGQRVRGWGAATEVPTLPEMLAILGDDGWELVSHVANQDNKGNGVTFHYYTFKRPKP